ncbi:hypothetical protein D3C87_1824540 [compost metagenome]
MNDRGDQEAADDEKDIDAGKSTVEATEACVKEQHGHDGERAQSIDFRSVMHQGETPRWGHLVNMALRR